MRHRHMQANPEPFLKAIAPYRDEMVVAVECLFPGTGALTGVRKQGSLVSSGTRSR